MCSGWQWDGSGYAMARGCAAAIASSAPHDWHLSRPVISAELRQPGQIPSGNAMTGG